MDEPLLRLDGISKTFRLGAHSVHAVRPMSLDILGGECLAIVGESGSGKSTVANMILGILAPSSGTIWYRDVELPEKRNLANHRAIQLVQQNPMSALNPNRTVGASLRLPLDVHKFGTRSTRAARVGELLNEVGLPADFALRPPSALSGGQRQRVAIARALACQPELVVLDEPTSALDVIVQARVLRLLIDLKTSYGLTYVFITHDLAVVRNVADRVLVLKEGLPVELKSTDQIFSSPEHPYTRNLIAASPVITDEEQELRDTLRAAA